MQADQQNEAYHLPSSLDKQGGNAECSGSATTERNHQCYYYNFEEKKMVPRAVQIEMINPLRETVPVLSG